MNMKQYIVFVFVVLFLLGYQNASAQETQSLWVIGRWDGNIEGFKGDGGPARMLRVNNISTEGAIVSLWGIPPQTRGRVEVKVDGSKVSVLLPSSKSTVELVRESDDVLVGK
jgi:DNA/RNA endonuclease YhcR with UshA esterase domain